MIQFFNDSDKPISIPQEYHDELMRYRSQGKKIRITISPVFETRTLAQNAYFHAKVTEISALTGQDRNDIKDEIKEYALGFGYPAAVDETGELKTDAEGRLIPLSSAKATIEQMETLIEALYSWCSEKGIYITEDL